MLLRSLVSLLRAIISFADLGCNNYQSTNNIIYKAEDIEDEKEETKEGVMTSGEK